MGCATEHVLSQISHLLSQHLSRGVLVDNSFSPTNMHPGQIAGLAAALAVTMVTLVAYMMLMSGDPSKTSTWHLTVHVHEDESGMSSSL